MPWMWNAADRPLQIPCKLPTVTHCLSSRGSGPGSAGAAGAPAGWQRGLAATVDGVGAGRAGAATGATVVDVNRGGTGTGASVVVGAGSVAAVVGGITAA